MIRNGREEVAIYMTIESVEWGTLVFKKKIVAKSLVPVQNIERWRYDNIEIREKAAQIMYCLLEEHSQSTTKLREEGFVLFQF